LLAAKKDILGDCQIGDQRQFLEHRANAGFTCPARAEGRIRSAAELQLSSVGSDGAREDLDEGGLSGAVLAEDGVHFAALGGEVHVVQGENAAVALADPDSFQQTHVDPLVPPWRIGVNRRCLQLLRP
jgi:hypothetical protein